MLEPCPRRQDAPPGDKNVSPWHSRSLLSSVYFPALLYGVVCKLEGGIPSMCTRWSSQGMVHMSRHTAKEATERSVTGGSPSEEISPLKSNNRISVE